MIGGKATRLLQFGLLLMGLALAIILVSAYLSPAMSGGHRVEDFIDPTLAGVEEGTTPMIEVVGVYHVETQESCYLLEVLIMNAPEDLELTGFTQEAHGLSRDNWQVPYEERFLSSDGTALHNEQQPWARPPTDDIRLILFFHYLDLSRSLQTGFGDLALPSPAERPERLAFITCELPD